MAGYLVVQNTQAIQYDGSNAREIAAVLNNFEVKLVKQDTNEMAFECTTTDLVSAAPGTWFLHRGGKVMRVLGDEDFRSEFAAVKPAAVD